MELTTNVRLFKRQDTNLKAFADCTLDDVFVIKNIKVMEGRNGLFVSMPSMRGTDGEYYPVCHPITSEFKKQFDRAIIEAYDAKIIQESAILDMLDHVTTVNEAADLSHDLDNPKSNPVSHNAKQNNLNVGCGNKGMEEQQTKVKADKPKCKTRKEEQAQADEPVMTM